MKSANLYLTAFLVLIVVFFAANCTESTSNTTDNTAEPEVTDIEGAGEPEDFPPLNLAADLPKDIPTSGDIQREVNIQAWETFLYLMWHADKNHLGQPDETVPFSKIGQPGDHTATVWESMKDVYSVFTGTNNPPSDWGADDNNHTPVGSDCTCNGNRHMQHMAGKTTGHGGATIEELLEAGGTGWLTDQNGNMVFYEVRMNEDEFKAIMKNNWWTAEGQYATIQKELLKGDTTNSIWLPSANDGVHKQGAMEFKAAWRIIPDGQEELYSTYYLTREACVPNEIELKLKGVFNPEADVKSWKKGTIALVGLHFMRKTINAPQWLWYSFEHVNNAPTILPDGSATAKPIAELDWAFYNPNSTESANYQTIKYLGKNPKGGFDYEARLASFKEPIQVNRPDSSAVSSQGRALNEQYQEQIAKANSASVLQYYKMVCSQWPSDPVANGNNKLNPKSGALAAGNPVPKINYNTSMETYMPGSGCTQSCHVFSTNTYTGGGTTYTFGNDYSHILNRAYKPKK